VRFIVVVGDEEGLCAASHHLPCTVSIGSVLQRATPLIGVFRGTGRIALMEAARSRLVRDELFLVEGELPSGGGFVEGPQR
jgi:hypothetical protein